MEIIGKFIRELHSLANCVNKVRNPTINYGGLLQMNVVDISDTFTMDIPIQILKPLAADFDRRDKVA
jgi:hypothetical protein